MSNWLITAKRFKLRPDFSNFQFQSHFVLSAANLPLREYPQIQNLQDGENVAREGGEVAFSFQPQPRLELAARWLINYQLVDPINLNHKVFFLGFSN